MSEREPFVLRLPPGAKERLERLAKQKGVSLNALILTIVDDWLGTYSAARFKHFNIYADHITLLDTTLGRLVDIYKRGKTLICQTDEATDCDHVKFCYTLPEVRKLVKKGELKEP